MARSTQRNYSATSADRVAALMLTNPNTCGLFERDILALTAAVHAFGAYFYADGTNFNAIVGKAETRRPWGRCDAHQPAQDLFHPTWRRRAGRRAGRVFIGTPAVHRPVPYLVSDHDGMRYVEAESQAPPGAKPFGRLLCLSWSVRHLRAGA